jgi:hypothetical protein
LEVFMRSSHIFLGLGLMASPLPGCDGTGGSGGDDNEPVTSDFGDIAVTYTVLASEHTVGGTECPQAIADLSFDNSGAEETVTCMAGEDSATGGFPIDIEGDSGFATGGDPASITVPEGGSAGMAVRFNCGQTTSFTVSITCENAAGDAYETDVSLDISS